MADPLSSVLTRLTTDQSSFDANNDGVITEAEINAVGQMDEATREDFDFFAGEDGVMSEEEFAHFQAAVGLRMGSDTFYKNLLMTSSTRGSTVGLSAEELAERGFSDGQIESLLLDPTRSGKQRQVTERDLNTLVELGLVTVDTTTKPPTYTLTEYGRQALNLPTQAESSAAVASVVDSAPVDGSDGFDEAELMAMGLTKEQAAYVLATSASGGTISQEKLVEMFANGELKIKDGSNPPLLETSAMIDSQVKVKSDQATAYEKGVAEAVPERDDEYGEDYVRVGDTYETRQEFKSRGLPDWAVDWIFDNYADENGHISEGEVLDHLIDAGILIQVSRDGGGRAKDRYAISQEGVELIASNPNLSEAEREKIFVQGFLIAEFASEYNGDQAEFYSRAVAYAGESGNAERAKEAYDAWKSA